MVETEDTGRPTTPRALNLNETGGRKNLYKCLDFFFLDMFGPFLSEKLLRGGKNKLALLDRLLCREILS